jgi:hypothetical protein
LQEKVDDWGLMIKMLTETKRDWKNRILPLNVTLQFRNSLKNYKVHSVFQIKSNCFQNLLINSLKFGERKISDF